MIDDHPTHGRYTLRDISDDDEQWLWPAYCEALRPSIEPLFGWDPNELRVYFDKSWRKCRIIQVDGRNAGWLELLQEDDWLYLHDIGLLPAFRNQGLGTRILDDLNAYADKHRLKIELQVLVTNPARHLYERLGFQRSHVKMFRSPGD